MASSAFLCFIRQLISPFKWRTGYNLADGENISSHLFVRFQAKNLKFIGQYFSNVFIF